MPKDTTFPAMPLYVRDWLTGRATAKMTPEQRGAFIDLLAHAWTSDPPCTLEDDDALLAKLSGLGRKWATAGALVKAQFQPTGDGLLRNEKQWGVYVEWLERRQRQQRGAEKTNAQRWHSDTPSDRLAMTERIATRVEDEYADEVASWFEEIWNDFLVTRIPTPVGKQRAQKIFLSSVRTSEDFALLKTALANYRTSRPVAGGFVQHASTWLNNWRDYVALTPEAPRSLDGLADDAKAAAIHDLIQDFLATHGSPKTPELRALFSDTFGFTVDEWNERTPEQIAAWYERLMVKA